MQPLNGITVVSLEQAIAAPFATRQLADLGARVIKVERPDGGDFARGYDARVNGLSSHFVWCNRSKESIVLDLKDPVDLEALRRLVSKADVFIQNLAPGAAARMGFSYENLKALHPRLIVCDISGYGSDGPDKDRKAYDLLIQSEAGLLSVTGTPDEMAKSAISIADIAAGMYAYSAILAALIERDLSGKGRQIDISMLESMAEWMGFPLYYSYQGAAPPPRVGASHATIYPYGPFATADGEVMLGLQNEREWTEFCNQVLERPALALDPRFTTTADRSSHRGPLRAIIADVFSALSSAAVRMRLDMAGIANARVNEMHDVWAHPQLAARRRWTEIETPAGPTLALLPPGLSIATMGPVPALGEHTRSILSELGFPDRGASHDET